MDGPDKDGQYKEPTMVPETLMVTIPFVSLGHSESEIYTPVPVVGVHR